ncbi:transmembrane transporter [Aureococcus anophagefferens]|nr:transmembrane transporter [Aureococcus anophagefferens]
MVGLGARSSAAPASRFRYVAANGLFLVNCTASSAYVILSKGAAPDAPTVSVTFRTYLRAAALMVLTTTVVNASGPLAVVCDDCGRRGAWRVPARALWALAYWVLGQSVVAYCLVTWATRRASSTLVSAFAVVQPVVAAALTAPSRAAPTRTARRPPTTTPASRRRWPALGAVPIFAGLFLVVRTEAPPAPPAPSRPLLLATDYGVQ